MFVPIIRGVEFRAGNIACETLHNSYLLRDLLGTPFEQFVKEGDLNSDKLDEVISKYRSTVLDQRAEFARLNIGQLFCYTVWREIEHDTQQASFDKVQRCWSKYVDLLRVAALSRCSAEPFAQLQISYRFFSFFNRMMTASEYLISDGILNFDLFNIFLLTCEHHEQFLDESCVAALLTQPYYIQHAEVISVLSMHAILQACTNDADVEVTISDKTSGSAISIARSLGGNYGFLDKVVVYERIADLLGDQPESIIVRKSALRSSILAALNAQPDNMNPSFLDTLVSQDESISIQSIRVVDSETVDAIISIENDDAFWDRFISRQIFVRLTNSGEQQVSFKAFSDEVKRLENVVGISVFVSAHGVTADFVLEGYRAMKREKSLRLAIINGSQLLAYCDSDDSFLDFLQHRFMW